MCCKLQCLLRFASFFGRVFPFWSFSLTLLFCFVNIEYLCMVLSAFRFFSFSLLLQDCTSLSFLLTLDLIPSFLSICALKSLLYSWRRIIPVTFIRNRNQIFSLNVSGLASHAWLSVCCLWRPNRKELVCFCGNLDTVSCRCCNGLRQGQFYQSRSMPCRVPYHDHSLVPCTDWRAYSLVVDFQSQKTDSFDLISKMLLHDGLLCALCILLCSLMRTVMSSRKDHFQ